jgi:hypothetical protein
MLWILSLTLLVLAMSDGETDNFSVDSVDAVFLYNDGDMDMDMDFSIDSIDAYLALSEYEFEGSEDDEDEEFEDALSDFEFEDQMGASGLEEGEDMNDHVFVGDSDFDYDVNDTNLDQLVLELTECCF